MSSPNTPGLLTTCHKVLDDPVELGVFVSKTFLSGAQRTSGFTKTKTETKYMVFSRSDLWIMIKRW